METVESEVRAEQVAMVVVEQAGLLMVYIVCLLPLLHLEIPSQMVQEEQVVLLQVMQESAGQAEQYFNKI